MTFTIGLKQLPFEPVENQVIYVENEYNDFVNSYILKNYDVFRSRFEKAGCHFCYFPKMTDELLRQDVVTYNAPFVISYDANLKIESDYLLQFMERPEERKKIPSSLISYDPYHKDDSYSVSTYLFRAVELTENNCYDEIDDFIDGVLFCEILGKRFCRRERRPWDKWIDGLRRFVKKEENEDGYDDWMPSIPLNHPNTNELSDQEIEHMLEYIGLAANKLRKNGVEEWVINLAVDGEVKLSRLYITKDYRLFLPDYKNIEIMMTPIHKVLYFLYLNHPEGIAFHDLVDYKDELMNYYKKIKGNRFDAETAEESINNMIDHTNNSILEKKARIKGAFLGRINDRYARHYYIDGEINSPKKIILPRNLVEWEDLEVKRII